MNISWIQGEISVDDYRRILMRANDMFTEYGLHRAADGIPDIPAPKSLKGGDLFLYQTVSKTWDIVVSRMVRAFEESPAIGEQTFNPELVARLSLCAAASLPYCDMFTLAAVSVMSAALNSAHQQGIVFPMGIAGRRISNDPVFAADGNRLKAIEFWTPAGAVKDDSVFRARAGDNEFPHWIHDLAEWCMDTSEIPLFMYSPENPVETDDGVRLWCLAPGEVVMCSSITVRHFWLAARCLKEAKKLADTAQAGLDEALMVYYAGNIWDIVASEAIAGKRVQVDLPPNKSRSRATKAVVFTKQIAYILREYVLYERSPEGSTHR